MQLVLAIHHHHHYQYRCRRHLQTKQLMLGMFVHDWARQIRQFHIQAMKIDAQNQ